MSCGMTLVEAQQSTLRWPSRIFLQKSGPSPVPLNTDQNSFSFLQHVFRVSSRSFSYIFPLPQVFSDEPELLQGSLQIINDLLSENSGVGEIVRILEASVSGQKGLSLF
jgi:hypothetical protein